MGIERNCPTDIWDVIHLQNGTEVIKVSDMEKLLKALTEECKSMIRSDGDLWADTPEVWLRTQLKMHDVNHADSDGGKTNGN